MTREEAIRKLQKQKAEYLEEWVDYSGVAEAYDMAIEALSADVVSRETYHNLLTASNDIDKALREYQDKEEKGELVSVVLCKDCKHYVDAETIPNKSCCGFCTKLGAVSYYGVDATDYCSFGERNE